MRKVFILILSLLSMFSVAIENEEMINKILNKINSKVTAKELFETYSKFYKKDSDLNKASVQVRYENFKNNLKNNSSVEINFTENFDASKKLSDGTFPPIDWLSCITPYPVANGGRMYYSSVVAFTSAIESAICIKTGQLTALSSQHVMDCTLFPFEYPYKYQFMAYSTGLYTAAAYPFNGIKSNCTVLNQPTVRVYSWAFSEYVFDMFNMVLDTPSIYQVLAKGPFISGFSFGFMNNNYTGGIFTPTKTLSTKCAFYWYGLVVGYGIDSSTSLEYWIVKSYMGSTFGDNGTFKLARNDTANNWGMSCGYWRPLV